MSVEEYGNSTTLVFAAQRIFPTWLFYFFIIGGPIMALLSTLNSSFAYNSITIGQSCDDGWLPKRFGKKNKSGARPYILTFMYVVGIIPIVFGLSITTITNMVQLITSAFAILNFTAEIKMPKKYPDAWKQSRYHVSDGLYYTICLCFSGAVPGRSVEEPALHEHRPGCHQHCGHLSSPASSASGAPRRATSRSTRPYGLRITRKPQNPEFLAFYTLSLFPIIPSSLNLIRTLQTSEGADKGGRGF